MCHSGAFGQQPALLHIDKYLGGLWEVKRNFLSVQELSKLLKSALCVLSYEIIVSHAVEHTYGAYLSTYSICACE